MTETTNLHLTKDDPSELYSVERVNANSDKIDAFAGTTTGAIADLTTAVNGKQDTLTFDNTPTENSSNPVKSGGVYTALSGKQATLTFDNTPTENSSNPAKSGGIYSAIQALRDEIFGPGTSIPNNTDITSLAPGRYYRQSLTNSGITGLPPNFSNAFYIEVVKTISDAAHTSTSARLKIILHDCTSANAGKIYTRTRTGNGWGDWFVYEGTVVS